MDELFGIDAQARQKGLSPMERHVLRLEKASRWWSRSTLESRQRVPVHSQECSAKACNYTMTLWTRLCRFLEYPELELSSNLAENAMRPAARRLGHGSPLSLRLSELVGA